LQKLNFALSHLRYDYRSEVHLVQFRFVFPLLNNVGQILTTIQQLFNLVPPEFISAKSTIVWKCYYSNEENESTLHLASEAMTSLTKILGYYSDCSTIVWSSTQFIKLELSSCFLIHHSIYFLTALSTEFPRILHRHSMEELSHPKNFSFSF